MKIHKTKAYVFLPLFLLILFAPLSQAQGGELNLKLMGGWAHSTTQGYLEPLDGLALGIGFEAWISKNLGLEIDGIYIQKGHKALEDTYTDSDGSFAELSVPLLLNARVYLDEKGLSSVGLSGGVAYSFILSEMDSNYSSNDINIFFGGNVTRWLQNIGLFLDARYDLGTKYLSIEYLPNRIEFKTRTLTIMAGFKVKI